MPGPTPGACDNPSVRRRRRLAVAEGAAIDIMFFVERLESMLANGKKLPLTSNVVVDQASALEIVDELRHAIPEEVQTARRINSDAERILERAEQEADKMIAQAQQHSAYLISEQGLTEAAQAESRRMLDEADTEAYEVRSGADQYAANVLIQLEGDVVRTLEAIRRGIEVLQRRQVPAAGEQGSGEGLAEAPADDQTFGE